MEEVKDILKADFPEYCTPLLDCASNTFSERSNVMIRQALTLALEKLGKMSRYDGTPFVTHSIDTALIVARDIGLGRNSVVSTIIHDVARMGLITSEQIEKMFGAECAAILKSLNNISEVKTKRSEEQIDNFKELILSYSTDPRVILIKLADRLEVMRSLDRFPDTKRDKKSWETLNLYSQIAHKLGLYSIKSEMEDLAIKYLHPEDYRNIVQQLADSAEERAEFMKRFAVPIEGKLKQMGYTYAVKGRTKSIYSIWRKMKKSGVTFDEIFDVFAIRVILDCEREIEKPACWGVYSVVTDFYTPNPERMRDWISIPKSNGYESLHTTVVTKDGKWVEVQIRTERMDEVAERGVAAHWRYKGVNQVGISSEEWLTKLRELMEAAESAIDISKKLDVAPTSKEIFVFTPTGDLRKLPLGATVLDFAFDIHSKIGNACTGARINHRNVSIKDKLSNGDVVEILTSKNQRPKPDWLNIVVTGKARQRIKVFLREEKAKAANLGREELERKLKNWKIPLTIDEAVNMLSKHYKIRTGTEFYGLLAEDRFSFAEIKDVLTGGGVSAVPGVKERGESKVKKDNIDNDGCLIVDDTLKQVKYKLGKCCNPIFGDDIFGFVTVSTGITIHRVDCPNASRLREQYGYRVLDARWRDEAVKGSFRASIKIVADDVAGLVNRINEVVTKDLKINIRSMNISASDGVLSGIINVEVTGTKVVDMIIHNLVKIKGVHRAYRGG